MTCQTSVTTVTDASWDASQRDNQSPTAERMFIPGRAEVVFADCVWRPQAELNESTGLCDPAGLGKLITVVTRC